MSAGNANPSLAWVGGRFVPWRDAVVPIEDRGFQFGESLYEVFPLSAGKVRLLDEHLARLRRGAEVLGIEHGIPEREAWLDAAAQLMNADDIAEGLLYCQLTGGTCARSHHVAQRPEPFLVAYLRPYRFPRAEVAERGIRVITMPDRRWAGCDIKSTMLLPAVLARREVSARGADEALLIGDDGTLREGTSSNVYLVFGRELVSPTQDAHILPGITQPLVGDVAREAGYSVRSETVEASRLNDADEILITSTSRFVLGAIELDGVSLRDGKPGPVALELAAGMRRRFEVA